jgi:hypothetical protein
MKTWHVYLQGEDHTEFTIEVQAETIADAREEAEDRYPEASILEVFDPIQRADDLYDKARRNYENDLDDYDY